MDHHFNQTFLPSVEKWIAKDLTDLALKEVQVTMEEIQTREQTLYKQPLRVAERATYQLFILNKKRIYDYQNYVDEFIEKCRELEVIANDIFNTEEEAFVDQNFNESFKEFALKVPNFSPVWISSFGRRNHFSWRIAHYARRG